MSYFDHSKAIFPKSPAPTRTYQSYMCPSKRAYLDRSSCKENVIEKQTWVGSQTDITRDKHLQQNITKLRNILSDTIGSLTRENNLKKGESVELTLEIELMKSLGNSHSNSLVEVTIIQHSKDSSTNKINQQNKMLFKIDKDKPTSEPVPQRQQSWFRKVVSKECIFSKPKKELRIKDNGKNVVRIQKRQIHKPLFCPLVEQSYEDLTWTESENIITSFINILPVETPKTENVIKGYQKISNRKSRPKPVHDICNRPETHKTTKKENLLINKISKIFLPSKKTSKSEIVQKELRALKDEIGKLKAETDNKEKCQHRKKIDETPVVKLGKMVNNILFDVMENVDCENQNQTELTLPLQYQSFFEPANTARKKNKKGTKRKTDLNTNKLYRSHSDTCCVRPLRSDLEAKVKSSNSISDCRSHVSTTTSVKVECAGDTKQRDKKRRKRSNHRDNSRGMKGDRRALTKLSVEDDRTNNVLQQSRMFSRNSLIQWNGRDVKVSKDLKARIEMLIVNELENVALKEGMQCDVVPLSSDNTSTSSDMIEKMSSFVCELDISDKNVKKIMKRKKSIHSKISIHSKLEFVEVNGCNRVDHGKRCDIVTPIGTQTLPLLRKQVGFKNGNDDNENINIRREVNICHTSNNDNKLIHNNVLGVRQNSVEIKYMNRNMKNWSTESQTANLYRPDTVIAKQRSKLGDSICQNSASRNNRYNSTGFVKIIKSDDSTWNNCVKQAGLQCGETTFQDEPGPSQNLTEPFSSTTGKSSSKTSTELDNSIEIELDIQDLEYILMEAKQKYNADKVLIEAKCVGPLKNRTKNHQSPRPLGKNSPSYTNQLLTNVAKKLEKYTKAKTRSKKFKK